MDLRRFLPWPVLAIGGFAFLGAVLWLFKTIALIVVLLVLVVVLVVAVVLLWRKQQEAQAAREIEHSIVRQADRVIERSSVGQLHENESLKKELLAAFEKLKKARKGAGSESLAQLPWVMLLGPTDSGKGTLVRRSGLHFVVQDESRAPQAVRGIGGTQGFDWWLAEEGVLLDLNGKHLRRSALDDDTDWIEFLTTLRQQRGARALNGVIVTVAVDQIAGGAESQAISTAQQIRERIRELIHHLGVVFPVYVVFTRCDQIAGFSEYFENLTERERSEPWGATFPLKRSEAGDAAHLFDDEFSVLMESLSRRRLQRASRLPDAMQRARAFVFPLQLERLRAPLQRFVGELFQPDPIRETAPFRGFYFATAYAGGQPVDRVLEPAAAALGLRMQGSEPPPVGQGSWFAEQLFTQVVFPDSGLVRSAQHVIVDLERQRRGLVRGGAIALGASLLGFALWSIPNQLTLARIGRAADQARDLVVPESPSDLNLRVVSRLEDLRAATERVERQGRLAGRPLLPPFFATAGGLEQPLRRRYAQRSADLLLDFAARNLKATLQSTAQGAPAFFAPTYHRYRAWSLLASQRGELQPADAPVLRLEVDGALGASRSLLRTGEQREFSKLVRRQVDFLCRHRADFVDVGTETRQGLRGDEGLSRAVAAWLAPRWSTDSLYAATLDEFRAQGYVPDSTGRQMLGEPHLLDGRFTVPGAFLRSGWAGVMGPRAGWYGRQADMDEYLRTAHGPLPDVRAEFLTRYAREYGDAWRQALTDTRLAPEVRINDPDGAKFAVANATNDREQLMVLLRRVRAATQLGQPAGDPMAAVQKRFAPVEDFFLGARESSSQGFLARTWSWIRRHLPFGNRAQKSMDKPKVERYREVLDQMAQALAKLEEGKTGDFLSKREEMAQAFEQKVGSPLRNRFTQSDVLEPLLTLLMLPFGVTPPPPPPPRDTTRTPHPRPSPPMDLVSAAIADQMRKTLEPDFARLRQAYPFNRNTTVDVDPAAFAAFFGPGGSFERCFTAAHIGSYLTESGDPVPGAPQALHSSIVACVRSAHAIREAMFSAGSPGFGFTVTPGGVADVEGQDAHVQWTDLRFAGGSSYYRVGESARQQSMNWPGADEGRDATLSVHRFTPLTYPGRWGLYRILDRGARTGSGSTVSVKWDFSNGAQHVKVTWVFMASTATNPFASGLFNFKLP